MKVYTCVLVFLLQHMYSTADLSSFSKLKLGPECITLSQLYNATATMCAQKDNAALWEKVIRCHDPLTENFMRTSGEGRCFYPEYGVDATDYNNKLEKVFFNVCGIVEAAWYNLPKMGACLVAGSFMPWIETHRTEVNDVKDLWGDEVPCNIGKCILALGLGVGA